MQTQTRFMFSLFFSVLIITSCNTKTSHKTSQISEDSVKIINGQVFNNVACSKDPTVTYCIYVPVKYEQTISTPVIFAFDPHGDGQLPVDLIKEDAERFGYIVVGSNNSKNGLVWENNRKMIDILFDDIFTKYSIDKQRVYTMGFSGGSRVASLVAIFKGGINGVIGCGAGFPGINQPIQNKFNYIGFVGNADFNMFEMNQLDKELNSMGFKHYIEIFNGKHEWPSKSVITDAFTWLEFNAYRDKIIPKKDTLLVKTLLSYQKQLETINRNNEIYNEYLMYKKIISFFEQLTDISEYEKMLNNMETSAELKKILKQKDLIEKREVKLQEFYSEAMQTKDTVWWKKEMIKINKQTIDSSNVEEILLIKRTFSYLSLVAFMNSSGALNSNKLDDAAKFIKIYGMVDPPNPDHFYFEACLHSLQGDTEKAFIALDNAISVGFSDKDRMLKDKMLDNIKGLAKYQELLGKMTK